jgi:hypothetical protein
MLTSVKVLSVGVRFGVHDDVKMLHTFLRCFPNAERLHIMVFVFANSCCAYIILHVSCVLSMLVHSALVVAGCIDLSSQLW